MIIVLFGQPGSGKTTLSNHLDGYRIDGDDIRKMFNYQNYSKEGRLENSKRIVEIAHYMSYTEDIVIVSAVLPYKETRNYLDSLNNNTKWVFLHCNKKRGREHWHIQDFDIPSDECLMIETSSTSIKDCVTIINNYINDC